MRLPNHPRPKLLLECSELDGHVTTRAVYYSNRRFQSVCLVYDRPKIFAGTPRLSKRDIALEDRLKHHPELDSTLGKH